MDLGIISTTGVYTTLPPRRVVSEPRVLTLPKLNVRSKPPVFWRTAEAYRNDHFQPSVSQTLTPANDPGTPLENPQTQKNQPSSAYTPFFLTSLWGETDAGNSEAYRLKAITAYAAALTLESTPEQYLNTAA